VKKAVTAEVRGQLKGKKMKYRRSKYVPFGKQACHGLARTLPGLIQCEGFFKAPET